MNYTLDKNFQIVDNTTSFIVFNKRKNLKLVLTEEQKNTLYSLVKHLSERTLTTEVLQEPLTNKLFTFLCNNGFVVEQKHVNLTATNRLTIVSFEPLLTAKLQQLLQQHEAPNITVVTHQGDEVARYDNPLFVKYTEQQLYVTNEIAHVAGRMTNSEGGEKFLTYVAAVMLNYMNNEGANLSWSEPFLQRIDLTFYTNEVVNIVTTQIDRDTFPVSILHDVNLFNYAVQLDYEANFPLVTCRLTNGEETYVAVGFTAVESYDNMLHVLKDKALYTSVVTTEESDAPTPNQRLLLEKLQAIYYRDVKLTRYTTKELTLQLN